MSQSILSQRRFHQNRQTNGKAARSGARCHCDGPQRRRCSFRKGKSCSFGRKRWRFSKQTLCGYQHSLLLLHLLQFEGLAHRLEMSCNVLNVLESRLRWLVCRLCAAGLPRTGWESTASATDAVLARHGTWPFRSSGHLPHLPHLPCASESKLGSIWLLQLHLRSSKWIGTLHLPQMHTMHEVSRTWQDRVLHKIPRLGPQGTAN